MRYGLEILIISRLCTPNSSFGYFALLNFAWPFDCRLGISHRGGGFGRKYVEYQFMKHSVADTNRRLRHNEPVYRNGMINPT